LNAIMSATAVVGHLDHADRHRWIASIAGAVALHIALAAFLLHLHAVTMLHPPPAAPSLTFIDLQPLPTPAPPAVVPPEPQPPPPEPQPQPIAKPVVPPKPVVVHRVTPQVPTPAVQPQTTSTAPAAVSTPAAPATQAAPAAPTIDHAVPRFTDLIAAQMERYKRYPAAAQKRGEQGVALVRFTLDRGGNVSNARIERSSGHGDLDDEVMALLRRAAPLPPIPADIAANTLDIVVPVSFALR
jgi:protein TonB